MNEYSVLVLIAGLIVAINTAMELWDRMTGKEKCDISVLQKSFYELTSNLNCAVTELRMLIQQTTKDVDTHDTTLSQHSEVINDHETRLTLLEREKGSES